MLQFFPHGNVMLCAPVLHCETMTSTRTSEAAIPSIFCGNVDSSTRRISTSIPLLLSQMRNRRKVHFLPNFIVPHNIMCRFVNAAGPQLLLQRLFRHFGFSLCGVVQLRSGLVWSVSYCEASETRSDVAAAQNASLFHLISPQHLRLPAAGNQLSQCSDCLALDAVWVSIKLHHTFFSLWWKKECARECNASLKKKTPKNIYVVVFCSQNQELP